MSLGRDDDDLQRDIQIDAEVNQGKASFASLDREEDYVSESRLACDEGIRYDIKSGGG